MDYLIAPSLLSADLTRLGEEVQALLDAGADLIHFDVMDNHYVPNLTFGPLLGEALSRKFPGLPLDVHLMTNPVDDLIERFAKAGAKRISIHPDACLHLDKSLQKIRELGLQAGIALNPGDSLACLPWTLHRLDFVLVMTVNPGFGGQKFIPEMLPKVREIKATCPQLPICVDGGIQLDNIHLLKQAGAEQFVLGTGILQTPDYQKTILALRKELQKP